MNRDEIYMQRCLELALNGAGSVSPNPMVGCVIVHRDRIIGEGWHRKYGEAHAEVNAIASVADPSLLSESTLYVNLEPCSHYGKTPPCADLIISLRLKRVVAGMTDPFEQVAGNGIRKLRDAGIATDTGVLEAECRELNKRFMTRQLHRRPYVILKWAQTADGFIAPDVNSMSAEAFENKRHITGFVVQRLVHKWRTEEDAIMVGTNTIRTDNPALNARAWPGRNPVRVTIDCARSLDPAYKIFDNSQRTLVFTARESSSNGNTEFIQLDFKDNVFSQILEALCQRGIQSLIVEGGTHTTTLIQQSGLWDEAQVFISPTLLEGGVPAPATPRGRITLQTHIDNKQLTIYRNTHS